MSIFKALIIYLILLYPSTARTFTNETDESRPFQLYFNDEVPLKVENGRTEVDFLFQIPDKHYLYRDILNVEFDSPQLTFTIVKPGGVRKFDEFMGQDTDVFYNQTAVLAKISFNDGYDFTQPLTGKIVYQGCSDRLCFRAMTQTFSFQLEVVSGGVTQNGTVPSNLPSTNDSQSVNDLLKSSDFTKILGEGIWMALLVTFLAGVLTSFTPCVLPIIPLTLAFIGVRTSTKFSTRVAHLVVFIAGVSLMYSSMGVASAILGQTLGFFYQSAVFLLIVAMFFFIMALWMFGFLNFNLPTQWQNSIARYQPRGYFRYLYSGMTVGFLAAPCVGPILGPLLVYISSTQDIKLGFILMMCYSLGMSLLFVVLGFASSSWIGRFGDKSLFVKRIFGMLLLAVSMYYVYIFATPYFSPQGSDGFFHKDLNRAFVTAKSSNKGVLIDFYADWCLPCHEWDKTVWSDPKVQKEVSQIFVPVKIDCTQETEQCQNAVERYNVVGWPTILFVDAQGDIETIKRLVGTVLSVDEFLEYVGSGVGNNSQ